MAATEPLPRASDPGTPKAAAAEGYVRQSVIQLVVSAIVIFVVLAAIGALFGDEMSALMTWISETIGVGGMVVTIFVIDGFTLPVPPDAVLLVIAGSPMQHTWVPVVCGLGLVSAFAGNVGFFVARRLGRTPFFERALKKHGDRMQALFERYGALAVAIGALTPVPFSVSCWAAGIFGMRWAPMAWATLLRVPRFVAYYLLIAASVHAL